MRFTGPTFQNILRLRCFVLSLVLLTASLSACKTSAEEDLTPQNDTNTQKVITSPENESSESDEEPAQDENKGEDPNAGNAGQTQQPTTQQPATPQPSTPAKETSNTPGNQTASSLKSSFDFPIGVAVVKERLEEGVYANIVKKEFSRIGAESNFKFKSTHPEKNKYTFNKADAIVSFAQQNNMAVHGHCLIWAKDSTMPSWLLNDKGDAQEFDRILKNHISTLLTHFRGKVSSWDVVNEAVADDGTLKDNIWLRKLGAGYILKAFKYAQEVDPTVKLFYNDYGQEFGGKKMNKIMAIIAEAKQQGIKIDGMGFQLHTVLRIDVNKIKTNMALAASKGLLIHVSEFDVSLKYGQPKTFVLTKALEKAQGEKVKEIVQGYMKSVPKNLQFGITTWGLGDKDSFFNKGYANYDHDYPLLFDRNYNPKDAYRGFLEASLSK